MILSLYCPVENGGCGDRASWSDAIDRKENRIILDCTNCGYRYSFPLDVNRFTTQGSFNTMPISEGKPEVKP